MIMEVKMTQILFLLPVFGWNLHIQGTVLSEWLSADGL